MENNKDLINKVNEEILGNIKVDDSDYANGVGKPVAITNHTNLFNTDITVESVTLNEEDNQIEVVMREPSNMTLACFPPRPAPDTVWKNIFAVNDEGKIYFKEKLNGVVTPKQVIEEKVEFKKS
jgi:hypothetical protein